MVQSSAWPLHKDDKPIHEVYHIFGVKQIKGIKNTHHGGIWVAKLVGCLPLALVMILGLNPMLSSLLSLEFASPTASPLAHAFSLSPCQIDE